jgi:hypothetical protein
MAPRNRVVERARLSAPLRAPRRGAPPTGWNGSRRRRHAGGATIQDRLRPRDLVCRRWGVRGPLLGARPRGRVVEAEWRRGAAWSSGLGSRRPCGHLVAARPPPAGTDRGEGGTRGAGGGRGPVAPVASLLDPGQPAGSAARRNASAGAPAIEGCRERGTSAPLTRSKASPEDQRFGERRLPRRRPTGARRPPRRRGERGPLLGARPRGRVVEAEWRRGTPGPFLLGSRRPCGHLVAARPPPAGTDRGEGGTRSGGHAGGRRRSGSGCAGRVAARSGTAGGQRRSQKRLRRGADDRAKPRTWYVGAIDYK